MIGVELEVHGEKQRPDGTTLLIFFYKLCYTLAYKLAPNCLQIGLQIGYKLSTNWAPNRGTDFATNWLR